MLNSEEYRDKGGVRCPACLSEELDGGPVHVDAGIAWQTILCQFCGANWSDTYTLTGYTNFESGSGNEKGDQL